MVGLAKNLQSIDAKDDKAQSLEAQIAAIEKENDRLEEDIAAMGTEHALESEARSRLNLKKEGEEVVVIVPKEGEPYEPLTDEEFLRVYEQSKRPLPASNGQEEFDAVEWVRSVLSGILKGREETIE